MLAIGSLKEISTQPSCSSLLQISRMASWQRSKRGPTFLNMGDDYPNPERVQIVIWERHRRSFPAPPHVLYDGKSICVDGLIEL